MKNENWLIDAVNQKYINFNDNITKPQIFFDRLKIVSKREPLIDDKDRTYMHMISREYKKDYQIPCAWCCREEKCTYLFDYNPMLNDHQYPRKICPTRIEKFDLTNFFNRPLKIWIKEVQTPKGIRNRVHCLDDINDYLIVLDIRDTYVILWTGFPIEYVSQKREYLKEYKKYTRTNNIIHCTKCIAE